MSDLVRPTAATWLIRICSMPKARKNALITGASLGIGRELAKLFAADQYDLVLVARDASRLAIRERIAAAIWNQRQMFPIRSCGDLGSAVSLRSTMAENIGIDVLINNAGFGKLGAFSEVSVEDSLGQIQLNIVALTDLLPRLFVNPMS